VLAAVRRGVTTAAIHMTAATCVEGARCRARRLPRRRGSRSRDRFSAANTSPIPPRPRGRPPSRPYVLAIVPPSIHRSKRGSLSSAASGDASMRDGLKGRELLPEGHGHEREGGQAGRAARGGDGDDARVRAAARRRSRHLGVGALESSYALHGRSRGHAGARV